MKKILRCFNVLVYPLILCLIILGVPRYGLAQEEIVIDNYYPSPAGYYDQLKVNTSLNFRNGASISTTGTAGEVAMITFNPPGIDGMVFEPREGAKFQETAPVTVVGDMINEQSFYFSIRSTLHGNNNITAHYIRAQQIVGQRITSIGQSVRGEQVRDTNLGLDLGASLVNRLDSDIRLLWQIQLTQDLLAGGLGVAALAAPGRGFGLIGIAMAALALSTLLDIALFKSPTHFLPYVYANAYGSL